MGKITGTSEEVNEKVVSLPGQAWKPVEFRPCWVSTRNERNFQLMMDIVRKNSGEGQLCTVKGRAGLGKTRTIQREAARNRYHYLLVLKIWETSDLGMLQGLVREIVKVKPPYRKSDCFALLVDHLVKDPRPIFLDEMDLAPKRLELVRQLTEVTAAPIILIGEESLVGHITQVNRMWSRTIQVMEFERVTMSDIIYYAGESAGLEVDVEAAGFIDSSPLGGDWRDIRRVTLQLVEIANARKTRSVNLEMAKLAVRAIEGEKKKG